MPGFARGSGQWDDRFFLMSQGRAAALDAAFGASVAMRLAADWLDISPGGMRKGVCAKRSAHQPAGPNSGAPRKMLGSAPAGPSEAIEVTVRLSFSRAGAVIGEPRVTYVHSPATVGLREKIAASVLAAIKTCTPLPFTPALGAAIAGRMFSIRFRTLPDSGGRRVI